MSVDLTIVALPKPFEGEFETIQWNAVQSWVRLEPRPNVILVGDERGTSEVAAEVGALHVPEVDRSRFGTPIISDVFERAEDAGRTHWLAYVNADIVLMGDFTRSVDCLRRRRQRFLMVGRRWDLDVDQRLSFGPTWERDLRHDALARGREHEVTGMDYFVYPRRLWGPIPAFGLGRFAWDNWLVWRATELGVPVVDATAAVLALHQNHAVGGSDPVDAERRDEERLLNIELAGDAAAYYTLDDASHVLTARGALRPAWSRRHLRRRASRAMVALDARAPRAATTVRSCLRCVRRLPSR